MRRLSILLFCLLLPALAQAQTATPSGTESRDYPGYSSIWVNDQAEVIGAPAEARITAALQRLAEETGVQMTVLTLESRWGYRGESLEDFATGLFNSWGIGDATRNDGILVVVLTADREMRIELGAGYPSGYNDVAREIIDSVFVPAFGRGDYEIGIEAGTLAVADRIAREFAAGKAPAPVAGTGAGTGAGRGGGMVGPFVLTALVLGAVFAMRSRIVDRFRRCPSCGARGLSTVRETVERATRSSSGLGL